MEWKTKRRAAARNVLKRIQYLAFSGVKERSARPFDRFSEPLTALKSPRFVFPGAPAVVMVFAGSMEAGKLIIGGSLADHWLWRGGSCEPS